jgi:hypothetical protein
MSRVFDDGRKDAELLEQRLAHGKVAGPGPVLLERVRKVPSEVEDKVVGIELGKSRVKGAVAGCLRNNTRNRSPIDIVHAQGDLGREGTEAPSEATAHRRT